MRVNVVPEVVRLSGILYDREICSRARQDPKSEPVPAKVCLATDETNHFILNRDILSYFRIFC